MRRLLLPAALASSLLVAGCSGMNDTQQRTLSGGAIGAGAGALGGAATGMGVGTGAALGGALGAGGGYLYDRHERGKLDP